MRHRETLVATSCTRQGEDQLNASAASFGTACNTANFVLLLLCEKINERSTCLICHVDGDTQSCELERCGSTHHDAGKAPVVARVVWGAGGAGWEAVMRVRCSRGLRVSSFHGPFFVRSSDLLALPQVGPPPPPPPRPSHTWTRPSRRSRRAVSGRWCSPCRRGGAALAGAAELMPQAAAASLSSTPSDQLPSLSGKHCGSISPACLRDFCASCLAFSSSFDQRGSVLCRQTASMQFLLDLRNGLQFCGR